MAHRHRAPSSAANRATTVAPRSVSPHAWLRPSRRLSPARRRQPAQQPAHLALVGDADGRGDLDVAAAGMRRDVAQRGCRQLGEAQHRLRRSRCRAAGAPSASRAPRLGHDGPTACARRRRGASPRGARRTATARGRSPTRPPRRSRPRRHRRPRRAASPAPRARRSCPRRCWPGRDRRRRRPGPRSSSATKRSTTTWRAVRARPLP